MSPVHAGTAVILSQTAAKLTVLDTETHDVRATIDLPKSPSHFTVSPDGREAYVTHSELGQVSVVDLASRAVVRTLRAPGSPFGVVASRRNTLFVGHWNSDQVHELDAGTGAVLRSATAGKAPAHLALTADGKLLLAAAREADRVTIFDAATLDVRATVPVGRAPFALATSHDGRSAAVANAQAGTVSRIDSQTYRVVKDVRVGAMPYGVAFSADDATVIVTNQQSGTVSLLVGDAVVTTAKVGSYPEGTAIAPDGRTAYVANWFSDDVSVIDIATAKQTARIKVPGGPRTVVILPDGGAP